jgi:predicted ribosomally synthesized peptide with nif11-like leader
LSAAAADAFIERIERDDEFAYELESVRNDADAVLEKVHAAGFDATPEEIREAFLDRYGAELTPEQLDQISGGVDANAVTAYVLVGLMGVAAAAAL